MTWLTVATPMPHHMVLGTTACAVVPGMLAGTFTHMLAGSVPLRMAATVTASAMCGAFCGAKAALRLSEEQLRWCYMLSLFCLGGRSFVAAGRNIRTLMARRPGALQ